MTNFYVNKTVTLTSQDVNDKKLILALGKKTEMKIERKVIECKCVLER